MEKENNKYEEIGKDVIEYVDTRLEHTKLSFIAKTIEIGSYTLSSFIIILLFLVFYFCLVCGTAIWLGNYFGALHIGFFIIMGIHFFFLILLLLVKKYLVEIPLQNKLTRIIFNSKK
jgi:hypothetical protein